MIKPLPFSPAMYPIFLAEKSPFNPPKSAAPTKTTDDGVCLALLFGLTVPRFRLHPGVHQWRASMSLKSVPAHPLQTETVNGCYTV
jgi:hypothetical protein